jgi:hypothetical protein
MVGESFSVKGYEMKRPLSIFPAPNRPRREAAGAIWRKATSTPNRPAASRGGKMKRRRVSHFSACDEYIELRPHYTLEWVRGLDMTDIQSIAHLKDAEKNDEFWKLVGMVHLPDYTGTDPYTAMHRKYLRPLKTAKMVLPEYDFQIHPAFKVMATNAAALRILHLCRVTALATVSRVFYRCFVGNNYFWYVMYNDLKDLYGREYNFNLNYFGKMRYEFKKEITETVLTVRINMEPLKTFTRLQLMRDGGMHTALCRIQPVFKTNRGELLEVEQTLLVPGEANRTTNDWFLTHFYATNALVEKAIIVYESFICGQKTVDVAAEMRNGAIYHRKMVINQSDEPYNVIKDAKIVESCTIDGILVDPAILSGLNYSDVEDGSYVYIKCNNVCY